MYRLLFEDRLGSREPFVTGEPHVFIGRDEACSVRLVERGVGDRHASIEQRQGGYYVRDLGSINGVRVNGKPVVDQRLASGDELELGSVRVRFEIVHEMPGHRRPVDLLQVAAAMIVVFTVLGQVALFRWIFSEPRGKHLRIYKGRTPLQAEASSETPDKSGAAAGNESLLPLLPAGPVPAAPAVSPPVLNRMIKIVRVDRRESADGVNLQVRVTAQVGERELDTAAVAIGVQFVASPEVNTVWATIPPNWGNFATRIFTVRCSGPPRQWQGYVVRTYYRKQLQDVVAVPPNLSASVPVPTP